MPVRAPSNKHDLGGGALIDLRGPFERFRQGFGEGGEPAVIALAVLIALMIAIPAATLLWFVLGLIVLLWSHPRIDWQLFVPMQHPFARFPKKGQKLKSERDPLDRPNRRSSKPFARGIFYMGNVASDGPRAEQLWLTDSVFRQHHTVFGTSGAGKTEKLLGYLFNSLCWGSGMVFFDGKGTIEFGYKVYATAQRFGRTEDVLFLNLMTGSSDLTVKTAERVSNTCSIYALGPAPFVTELTVSMMPDSGGDGMWKDRAIALGAAVIGLCTFDRDKKGQPFSPGKLRSALSLKYIIKRSKDKDLPPVVAASVNAYLSSLPGFKASAGADQDTKTLEQHGFLEMQFTKILGTLADTYGHVFNHLLGDIYMRDVVVNNRILAFLLPSLEKSGHESRSLGNLGMALIRSAMAAMMGFKLEGSASLNIETLPTRATYPYPVIYDEIGYYMPKDGTAIQAAQARGLGIGVVIAAQDKTKLDQAGREETDAIIGTTRVKHFMAVENAPTSQVAIDQAGQADVAVKSGYERESGFFGQIYRTAETLRIESKSRITQSELRAQGAGSGTVLYADRIIKADYFYAAIDTKPVNNLAINQFLEVQPVDAKELVSQTREYTQAVSTLFDGLRKLAKESPVREPLLVDFADALKIAAREVRVPVEQVFAACGLMAVHRDEQVGGKTEAPGVVQDLRESEVTTPAASLPSDEMDAIDRLSRQLADDLPATGPVEPNRPASAGDDGAEVPYEGLSRTADDIAAEMAGQALRGLQARIVREAPPSVHPIQEAVHDLLQLEGMDEAAMTATEAATVGVIEQVVLGDPAESDLGEHEARLQEQAIFEALEAIADGR